MGKKRINIWDLIAWLVLAGIVLWLVLKVMGVINTPILIEYAPYFGAVYIAGWAMNRLNTATEDIRDIKKELRSFEKRTSRIEYDMPTIKGNYSAFAGK